MATQLIKLIASIDELVVWFRENPGSPIPSREKTRLDFILRQLQSREVISEELWARIKPLEKSKPSPAHIKPTTKKFKPKASKKNKPLEHLTLGGKRAVKCEGCGVIVILTRYERHKKKCKGIRQKNKVETKGKTVTSSSEKENIRISYKEERRLDGSRDYFSARRELGRFGSHSLYDDMGDESNP